jgi:hypothetical protein
VSGRIPRLGTESPEPGTGENLQINPQHTEALSVSTGLEQSRVGGAAGLVTRTTHVIAGEITSALR